jgi:hypothetical protein
MRIEEHISAVQKELDLEADGLWGPKTNAAYLQWRANKKRKITPQTGAPLDTPQGLRNFYGNPGDSLVRLVCPYPMVLAWEPDVKIKSFMCHEKVHDSLMTCLQKILKVYKTQDRIEKARMHLFGGCYNDRNRRGGRTLSTHAWAAAIDLDPARNGRGKPYKKDAGMIPMNVVDIFEDAGWTWGGRFSTPDAMHFQYAKIRQ